jgi:hypothetical protein
MTKNSEDGIQIVEQIVPFFTPDFTVTMKALPELGVNLDIPIELSSITSDDQYEGDFETRRVLTWDLEFIVKGYLFGPATRRPYVTSAEISTFQLNLNEVTSQELLKQTFTGNGQFLTSETITP